MRYQLHNGDCLDVMANMEPNSVDSIVTDPPYGLSFMGKDWDHGVPGVHFWQEALRVAKPGAHLLAFGGTRTFHRLACAIEDAGWELRDTVMWVYGSGFPKSHDVSKAIDKAAGAEREVIGKNPSARNGGGSVLVISKNYERDNITAPATDAARKWQGWGTALKPAWEPVIVARKPLTGTVAANVLTWGTGAINVDGCRIATTDDLSGGTYGGAFGGTRDENGNLCKAIGSGNKGRWPANLIHDGSEEVAGLFPWTSSGGPAMHPDRYSRASKRTEGWGNIGTNGAITGYPDTGRAARFFYAAKASKADRDDGCEGMEEKRKRGPMTNSNWSGNERFDGQPLPNSRNPHPTVKPTNLMRYLCRLVTPPDGVILDPFMGSGSTGKAAMMEGFRFVGIELDADYVEIARRRIEWVIQQTPAQLSLLEIA